MRPQFLDKAGTVGAFLAAASCPACFPLLGIVGATLGLGFLRPYEGIMMYVFQGLVFLSLIGNILSYLKHRRVIPLTIGILSPLVIFFAFYIRFSNVLIYSGLAGLLVAIILNYWADRRCTSCQKN